MERVKKGTSDAMCSGKSLEGDFGRSVQWRGCGVEGVNSGGSTECSQSTLRSVAAPPKVETVL